MSKVTVIPATINPITRLPRIGTFKRRAAGYARVSTDKDEQFSSYEAQVDYYTKYIKAKPDLEFVAVYTDEGITGTSTKKREGFNQMIEDALNGKIDLIITKSVSRFARNTVDSLTTIRKLKESGTEVYFEKENIWSFDSKGELLLTIMSSLAQEESRSISENITWGKRKSASDGKICLAYTHFLGYDKGPNGTLIKNEEQAKIIRRIYHEFMSGKTTWMIAEGLTADGIPTPSGKQKWSTSTLESILTNEKYMGAALLQKSFTVDFLTKKLKPNEGEVPQYYVENSHEPIIAPDEWKRVQKEIVRRRSIGRKYSGNSIFSSRIVCGDCGAFYGSKVWNSTNEKYRRIIWQCNDKFKSKNKRKCTTPHFSETEIKLRFIDAFNQLFSMKKEVLENCRMIADTICDCSTIDSEQAALQNELEIIAGLTKKLIDENATTATDQEAFLEKYNDYSDRYNSISNRLNALQQERLIRQARAENFEDFLRTFSATENSLLEFDDRLWIITIDRVIAMADGSLRFIFQNGTEIIT